MLISECQTYQARLVKTSLLHMPDGKSAFKIYYLSIINRSRPERYEWAHCASSIAEFEQQFLAGPHEGIGFVIAFPHVTKIFRFSPWSEIILDVREFVTGSMTGKDITREDGSHEFACHAEAVIAAEEYDAWAASASVEAYLESHCSRAEFLVADHAKLARYWGVRD